MRPTKARYIAICQQLLALSVVLLFLVPATGVASLDILPGGSADAQPDVDAAPAREKGGNAGTDQQEPRTGQPGAAAAPDAPNAAPESDPVAPAKVATKPVTPTVREVPLKPVAASTDDAPSSDAAAPSETASKSPQPSTSSTPTSSESSSPQSPSLHSAEEDSIHSHSASPDNESPTASAEPDDTQIVATEPEKVADLAAVGISWDSEAAEGLALRAEIRTLVDGQWNDWEELVYHPEEGPDPDSAEGQQARPGTDPTVLADVDKVQARVIVQGEVPQDLELALVDPGTSDEQELAEPAIDTADPTTEKPRTQAPSPSGQGTPESSEQPDETPSAADLSDSEGPVTDDDIDLQAGTPKPRIFSRKQWGANERMRDKGSLSYAEVNGGFVHHTVNSNSYSRSDVPRLIRSIYAYHTQTRGWSDVGYNFLIDKFGRIWEGRYGGVAKAVQGAHTRGYNDDAFAASAIGNFDIARPRNTMVRAFGKLFAWKLSVHGVTLPKTVNYDGEKFPAIGGHRDAGSTACPGRYLYSRLNDIRRIARNTQGSATSGPTPEKVGAGSIRDANLVGDDFGDVVLRRASNKKVFILPLGGLSGFHSPQSLFTASGGKPTETAVTPDLNRNGNPDLFIRFNGGKVRVYPGKGASFGSSGHEARKMRYHDRITPVGDINNDGYSDVVAVTHQRNQMWIFYGKRDGTFEPRVRGPRGKFDLLVAPGDITGDQKRDLLGRTPYGNLYVMVGKGNSFGAPRKISTGWDKYDSIVGWGDLNRDGRPDLIARQRNRMWFIPTYGDVKFAKPRGPMAAFASVKGLGAGHLDGDSAADLVGLRDQKVVTLRNSGRTEALPLVKTNIDGRNAKKLVNGGDWDNNGHGDVIELRNNGHLMLWRGDGTGGFARAIDLGSGYGGLDTLSANGDVSGDGKDDLVARNGTKVYVLEGNGTSKIKGQYVARTRVPRGQIVGAGRWGSDHSPDILMRDGGKLQLGGRDAYGKFSKTYGVARSVKGYDEVLSVNDIAKGKHGDLVGVRGTRLYLRPGGIKSIGYEHIIRGSMRLFDRVG